MAKEFCFKCTSCGAKEIWPWLDTGFRCSREQCPSDSMVRDYRAENASVNIENLKGR